MDSGADFGRALQYNDGITSAPMKSPRERAPDCWASTAFRAEQGVDYTLYASKLSHGHTPAGPCCWNLGGARHRGGLGRLGRIHHQLPRRLEATWWCSSQAISPLAAGVQTARPCRECTSGHRQFGPSGAAIWVTFDRPLHGGEVALDTGRGLRLFGHVCWTSPSHGVGVWTTKLSFEPGLSSGGWTGGWWSLSASVPPNAPVHTRRPGLQRQHNKIPRTFLEDNMTSWRSRRPRTNPPLTTRLHR